MTVPRILPLGWLFLFIGAPSFAQTLSEETVEAQQAVSEQVHRAAEFIDLTLAGKKYSDVRNTSQVSVSQQVSLTEGGVWHQSTDLGVNLRLPNVEKQWQARFSTYDEEEEDRDLNRRLIGTGTREKNPGAALLFFKKLGDIKTTFQPRVQLTNPLQVGYVLKFENEGQIKWLKIKPTFELLADANKGAGEYFSLGFYEKLGGRWSSSQQNEEEYDEAGNAFTTRHGVTFDYQLNDTQGLGWATVLSSANHDFHLDSVNVSMAFNHQLIKKILRYTFSPFLGFAKADNFKGKAGVMLYVELTI